MTHPSPELLSLHLDQDLDSEADRQLAAHVAGCAQCAALLEELRRVVLRARALEDRPPRADLWPGVAAAIGATPAARRGLFLTVPQLLAAGIALMLMTGSVVALVLRAPISLDGPTPATAPAAHAGEGDGYERAVLALTAELGAGRGRLDSTTVRVVEEKLRLVDRAILEAERALAADPANGYLTSHLTQTRMHKLDLLRRAALLSRAVS